MTYEEEGAKLNGTSIKDIRGQKMNSRQKGKRGELEVANILKNTGMIPVEDSNIAVRTETPTW